MKHLSRRLLLVVSLATALTGGLTSTSATAAEGPQRIVNYHTSGSLIPDGYGRYARDGLKVETLDPSRTRGNDRWTFEDVGGGKEIIRNVATGKCLKPGNRQIHRKTRLEQWTCNNTLEFQWRRTYRGDNTYKITSVASRQVLAPYRGKNVYEPVVLEPDLDTAKQFWSITPLY